MADAGRESGRDSTLHEFGRLASPVTLSVLVPVYNEARTIDEALRRVLALDFAPLAVELDVIVCDDASDDATLARVRELQGRGASLSIVAHTANRGKGAAIRSALARARGEYVVIQDADLEYDANALPSMLAVALEGADVVYGSRFLLRSYPRGMHISNYLGNRLLTLTANRLFAHSITDEATCLKLFRTGLLRSLALECERFDFCPEVTAKVGLRGVPIREVPVDYQARRASHGKKVRWTDAIEALRVMFSQRFGRR